MFLISTIQLMFFQAFGVVAAPSNVRAEQPHAKWFNSFWTDNSTSVKYNNLANGAYSVTWNGTGNFVGGKGWNPGSTSR